MDMSAEHRLKFTALRHYWWHLQMMEKFSCGTKIPKQTNKQATNVWIFNKNLFFYYRCHLVSFMKLTQKISHWFHCLLLTDSCPRFIISRQCAISPYVDECNNTGFLWNCSGLGLNTLPSKFPPELKNQNVTLDLSFNNISEITKETFREISLFCNVTTIKLHHNNFGKIGKMPFQFYQVFAVWTYRIALLIKIKLMNMPS